MGLWGKGTRKSCPRGSTENLSKPLLLAHFQPTHVGQLQNFSGENGLQNHPPVSPRTSQACLLLLTGLASAVSVEAPCGLHCTYSPPVTEILRGSIGMKSQNKRNLKASAGSFLDVRFSASYLEIHLKIISVFQKRYLNGPSTWLDMQV